MIQKTLGPLSFELKEDFDFAFLSEYGEPFAVFDDQDSGNLCFGVQGERGKLFLKLAGVATKRGSVSPAQAMERLRGNVPIYRDLRHPALCNLLEAREIPQGFLLVFEWFDGLCMGRQYGQTERFLALPVAQKLSIYRTILDFHLHVAAVGYVPIDFYDGAILYNFATGETRLCDIEFYHKGPLVNTMGRMWGSGRYMSPEEFELGAVIDEISGVFCMGATAFQLLGGGVERDEYLWEGAAAQYAAAKRATDPDRNRRFLSIQAYVEAFDGEG